MDHEKFIDSVLLTHEKNAAKNRELCSNIRTKPYPISTVIPALQESADSIENLLELLRISRQSEREAWRYYPELKEDMGKIIAELDKANEFIKDAFKVHPDLDTLVERVRKPGFQGVVCTDWDQ